MSEVASGEPRREYLAFGGSGAEYFRIWAANIVLTVLTLGIYSAWAKVRRNRYIYGNTTLLEGRFDYHARPLAILFGRAIAVGLLLLYLAAQAALPLLTPLLAIAGALVIPWLIVRSRMFNMRYTSYRNIRFGFAPAYGESYRVLILFGLLTVITLGIAAPYAHYQRNRFIVNNTRFGNLRFAMPEGSGSFFFAYFATVLAGLVIVGPLLTATSAVLVNLQAEQSGENMALALYLPLVLGVASYFVIAQFLSAATLRATIRAASLAADDSAPYRLGCDWGLNRILFIYVTNLFAALLSLGLLIPWGQMRAARYQLSHTWIELRGDLSEVVAGQQRDVSALGEEIGDIFDVDIGL